ncbi:MAG TPA: type II toxin-antitoxin system VapC family toxin [Ilumatobacter sp.]|nr:type II toxin-antitoxin system VapC family toxin [Ilumatobacter sp.]
MTVVYFDSSALVKLLLDEPGSDLAIELWNGCDAALASRLAHPEVCAALAATRRNKLLTADEVANALAEWTRFWGSMRPVELTSGVEQLAGDLARAHQLRGADAVHLASALTLDIEGLVVAVWDKRLHAGAIDAGLAVAPASIA